MSINSKAIAKYGYLYASLAAVVTAVAVYFRDPDDNYIGLAVAVTATVAFAVTFLLTSAYFLWRYGSSKKLLLAVAIIVSISVIGLLFFGRWMTKTGTCVNAPYGGSLTQFLPSECRQ